MFIESVNRTIGAYVMYANELVNNHPTKLLMYANELVNSHPTKLLMYANELVNNHPTKLLRTSRFPITLIEIEIEINACSYSTCRPTDYCQVPDARCGHRMSCGPAHLQVLRRLLIYTSPDHSWNSHPHYS